MTRAQTITQRPALGAMRMVSAVENVEMMGHSIPAHVTATRKKATTSRGKSKLENTASWKIVKVSEHNRCSFYEKKMKGFVWN